MTAQTSRTPPLSPMVANFSTRLPSGNDHSGSRKAELTLETSSFS